MKPLRECPICELPDLSHTLQQLLWYYIVIGESTDLCLPSMTDIGASASNSTVATSQVGIQLSSAVVTYAHYACVSDCADAIADAWEDTAGCAQPICLHENLLK